MDTLTKEQRAELEKWFEIQRYGEPVTKTHPILVNRNKYVKAEGKHLKETSLYIYTLYIDNSIKPTFEAAFYETLKKLQNELPQKSY